MDRVDQAIAYVSLSQVVRLNRLLALRLVVRPTADHSKLMQAIEDYALIAMVAVAKGLQRD